MENKSNKELAVEATIEYIKAWNSADRTKAATVQQFNEALQTIYSTICSLDTE